MPEVLAREAGCDVEVIEGVGAARSRAEHEARSAGLPLPLSHTLSWARSRSGTGALMLVLRGADGRCTGVIALERSRSRALPGHILLRAQRVGAALLPGVEHAAARALRGLARSAPRVLRVSVELFCRDEVRRGALAQALADAGFCACPAARSYSHTLTLDLTPDEDELLARLRAKTRRDIRVAAKSGFAVRALGDDGAWESRLDALHRETMARTRGPYVPYDWRSLLQLARHEPERVRISGLFRPGDPVPSALVAFALGFGHGDHGEYHLAGSERAPDLKIPLAYPLLWDLVLWARRAGSSWFDFGGVTTAHRDEDEAGGGISDFKRYFSTTCVAVGEEWMLEPRRARAELANIVSAGAAWFTSRRARA